MSDKKPLARIDPNTFDATEIELTSASFMLFMLLIPFLLFVFSCLRIILNTVQFLRELILAVLPSFRQ